MKRILFTVLGTAAGVVSLLSFKTSSPVASAGPLPSARLPSAAATPRTTTRTGSIPTRTSRTRNRAPATRSSAAPSPTPQRSAAPAPTARKVVGQAIQTQYGIVQVMITLSGRKITNVAFKQLTAFDSTSQQINAQAAPILLNETITAQSAHIDAVSGASYTSAGYVQSLQSAIDSAGI